MNKSLFEKSIDRTHLNRLEGEILAFVSDFEQQGYDNMEIARALFYAGVERAGREDGFIYESFLQFVRDWASRFIVGKREFVEKAARQAEKEKWN